MRNVLVMLKAVPEKPRKEDFMNLLTIVIIVLVLAVVFGGFGFSRRGR